MNRSTTKKIAATLALAGCTTCALAQQAPASADQDANAPSERAKRMSENPYKWIMIMDDKPRPKKDEPREPRRAPAAPAATAPASAPAPAATAAPAAAAAPPTPRSFEPRVPANQAAAQPAAPAPMPTAPAVVNPPVPTVVAPAAAPSPALAAASPALRDAEAEDEPLRALKQVQPEMTRQIATSGVTQGRVRAKFTVALDGSVTNPEIVNSTNRVLNSSVLTALAQWKYAPIKEPRDAQVEFAFDFSR
jgi:periplasmic protein TonB